MPVKHGVLYGVILKKLNGFHMRCLRQICYTKWEDMIPDTEILSRAGVCGLEFYLLKSQFRWAGQVVRMPNSRILKQLCIDNLKKERDIKVVQIEIQRLS